MRSMRDKHTRSRCSSRGKKIEEFLEERGCTRLRMVTPCLQSRRCVPRDTSGRFIGFLYRGEEICIRFDAREVCMGIGERGRKFHVLTLEWNILEGVWSRKYWSFVKLSYGLETVCRMLNVFFLERMIWDWIMQVFLWSLWKLKRISIRCIRIRGN